MPAPDTGRRRGVPPAGSAARAARSARIAIIAMGILSPGARGEAREETLGKYARYEKWGRGVVFVTQEGARLRITPYDSGIIRVQAARNGEEFFPDDRYEMVVTHAQGGEFRVSETARAFILRPARGGGLSVRVTKSPLRAAFLSGSGRNTVLAESKGVSWENGVIRESFVADTSEHFTGLGHAFYGRSGALDLRGVQTERNYGRAHGDQAPLIVPFYLSSRGYGVFLNSTFPNSFSFGHDGAYAFSLEGEGRMDFFVIPGPSFASILDRYTALTGRPRFPPMAAFGLGLSDKGNDEKSADPSDEAWWKRKVGEHRAAGFPLDHLINDNRWRAGGGKRCESYFAWDSTRFPDPAEYERWVRAQGLFVTIDFNRCIAAASDGWSPSFNIPSTAGIDHGESAPDFTRPDVRKWFWNLHWMKSLDPALGFPGDALWIDEFDELGAAPDSMLLGNGRTWREMKNYWFFLIAKALVQEGWDRALTPARRPFVWVRGMTAGAQRYATLWSGDIRPTYDEMQEQVRGMQRAGLSGFPFWGHDAGGFHDWEKGRGPDDLMYRRWSMAMGSFSPFWKPHGMGESRWPLDRTPAAQEDAHTYTRLRYTLMPYTYTYAHEAAAHGLPIARAMLLGWQDRKEAWRSDLQYMWGDAILVAPNCSGGDTVRVWLPPGEWFRYQDDAPEGGGRTIACRAPGGTLPLFVKAGSVIPTAEPALATDFIHRDTLIVHVYTGRSGSFTLYEDDGKSELYRSGASRTTLMKYSGKGRTFSVGPSAGTYNGAPARRTVRVVFHGLRAPAAAEVNGRRLKREDAAWLGGRLTVHAGTFPVTEGIVVTLRAPRPGPSAR